MKVSCREEVDEENEKRRREATGVRATGKAQTANCATPVCRGRRAGSGRARGGAVSGPSEGYRQLGKSKWEHLP